MGTFTVRHFDSVHKDFLQVPLTVNRGIEHFIPALQMDVKNVLNFKKNPFWKECLYDMIVIYKDGQALARGIVLLNKKHIELYNDGCAYFGYTEFVKDQKVFQTLMDALLSSAEKMGAEKIMGPLNPSVNYELGVLSSGYDLDPCFMMNYNQAYYTEFYMNHGFQEAMRFYAYSVPNYVQREKINRVIDLLKTRRKVTIKEIDFKNFKEEAIELSHIYNDAFSHHFGYLPFSEEEFLYVAKDMTLIMNKRLIFKVAVDGEIAGFILALPDMNEVIRKLKDGRLGFIGLLKFFWLKRKIKRVKVMVAAIRQKFQHLGLGSLLYAEMADRVRESRYEGGELSWVSADNSKMNEIILEMGGKCEKEYVLYQLQIDRKNSAN